MKAMQTDLPSERVGSAHNFGRVVEDEQERPVFGTDVLGRHDLFVERARDLFPEYGKRIHVVIFGERIGLVGPNDVCSSVSAIFFAQQLGANTMHTLGAINVIKFWHV